MSRKKFFPISLAVAMVAVVGFSFFGCSSKSTQDQAPVDDGQMAVSASPTSVETSETSVVEATITSLGAAVANQVVHFTVSPAEAGYLTPAYDTTNAGGVAATVFTASTAGVAVVMASVDGTDLSGSVGMSISEASGGGGTGQGNINVTVSENLLTANGEDTSQVTIVVRDALGQPAADGTLIRLVAGEKFVDNDGNGYWSEGVDSLVYDVNSNEQWDPIGLIPSTAVTSGGTGSAVVDFVSGPDAYTVYVKVSVDDGGLAGEVDVPIQLAPNAQLASIYLSSDSISLSVRSTGGIETATIRAVGYDINGNTVPEGMTIVFAILDGPGGGESLDTLAYGPDSAVTNSQGVATTTIHSGTISGTVRVRAYSETILSNAAQVLISAGPPAHIVLGAGECNTPSWARVADTNGITAVVSDVYLNPVNDSTVVYFSTDEGTMMSHQARTKGGQGLATSTWYSGNNVDTADGVVMIMAETSGGTVADTSFFYNSYYPAVLIVSGVPATMMADGSSKATVVVTGLDLNGNPVVGGTQFEAEASYVTITGGTLQNGCYASTDRVKITSTTLEMDHSRDGSGNDDGVGAIDMFYFWHGAGAYSSFVCSLLTGPAYSGNSSINGETSAKPGDEVRLSVTIADRWGNPLADHTLNMTATSGVVTGASQETDAYGEAFGFIWTAPGADGDYTVVLTDTDPRGGIVLTLGISVSST
ncbi:MAG: hypothetical protein GY867_00305 [bacterium]|nr:hypothetical protein [bacterium]